MSDQATAVLSKNGVSLADALKQRMVWVLKTRIRPFPILRFDNKAEDPVWCRVYIEQLVGELCDPKGARILDMDEHGLCDHINYVTVYWPEVTASLSETEKGGDA